MVLHSMISQQVLHHIIMLRQLNFTMSTYHINNLLKYHYVTSVNNQQVNIFLELIFKCVIEPNI